MFKQYVQEFKKKNPKLAIIMFPLPGIVLFFFKQVVGTISVLKLQNRIIKGWFISGFTEIHPTCKQLSHNMVQYTVF